MHQVFRSYIDDSEFDIAGGPQYRTNLIDCLTLRKISVKNTKDKGNLIILGAQIHD